MKFVEKKITEIEIDFGKPFDSWNGEQSGKQVTKKIIPIIHNGERKNWWMNTWSNFKMKLGKKKAM